MSMWSDIASMKYTDRVIILIMLIMIGASSLWVRKQLKGKMDYKTSTAVNCLTYVPVAILMYTGYSLTSLSLGVLMLIVVELTSYFFEKRKSN